MAQNNDGPGKRLKREEAKNILYVEKPNDPRLKRYRDSLSVYNTAEKNWDSARKFGRPNPSGEVYIPTQMVNAIPGVASIKTKFEPEAYRSTVDENRKANRDFPIYKKPERPVVLLKRQKAEVIEPIQPRQATLTPQEIIAPVMRPVDVPVAPPMKEPVMEEETITERPVEKKEVFWRSKEGRKMPRAVMPRRAGGWSNQPLLMQLFPKLYQR
jgi:hypothetical protein